ncbi:MAG: DUF4421 family protein [Bacteroidota bacterium]|nr:DUF4421 family protein [Bacteroidota bacterium]
MKQARFILTGTMLTFFLWVPARGQFLDEAAPEIDYDTSYIRVYKDELTTRLYLSRKQNGYTLTNGFAQPWMQYKTNDNILLGLGYTYSFLTINLGVKLPLINDDDDIYGESNYLDLQTHFMFRSFIMDLYLQWNSGYYLSNPEEVYPFWQDQEARPVRGDMRTNIVGLSAQYLFNSDRFSYKASFWQNEFQRKSAGSPIVGIEAYYMLGMTDSMMVEDAIPSSGYMDDLPFNQNDMMNAGLSGGYAYTFVYKEKLSLSLSTVLGLSGSFHRVHYTPDSYTLTKGLSVGLTNTSRLSLGYNTAKHYFGISYQRFWMSVMAGSYKDWYSYNTGHVRINFVKRIHLKRPIKILRPDLWIL